MRIFMVPCTLTCRNMGDMALIQVAVARLSAMWPDALIQVPTNNPELLVNYCPQVTPLAYDDWLDDQYLLGVWHQRLPKTISHQLITAKHRLHRQWPALVRAADLLKQRMQGYDSSDFRAYIDAVAQADLVAVSGAGGMSDRFRTFVGQTLGTLELAIHAGKPTALFSQGIGPLRSPVLRARMKATLPRVDLIALRENRAGTDLLTALGVQPQRVAITGDDAVELAYEARPASLGDGIGVNLRVAPAAEVDLAVVERLRPILHSFARSHNARLIGVPIALQRDLDPQIIRQLLAGYDQYVDEGASLDTPLKVIQQVGRCRIVVTGAYHAAVFALAQGIPAVCLAQSEYYVDKFCGLAGQFGDGCQVVLLKHKDAMEQIDLAMERAWASADRWRESLMAAAVRQISDGYAAYQRVGDMLTRNRTEGYVQATHWINS